MGLEAILSAIIRATEPPDGLIERKTFETLSLTPEPAPDQPGSSNTRTYNYKNNILNAHLIQTNAKTRPDIASQSQTTIDVDFEKECLLSGIFENIIISSGWKRYYPVGPGPGGGMEIPGDFFKKNNGYMTVGYDARGRCITRLYIDQNRPLSGANGPNQ